MHQFVGKSALYSITFFNIQYRLLLFPNYYITQYFGPNIQGQHYIQGPPETSRPDKRGLTVLKLTHPKDSMWNFDVRVKGLETWKEFAPILFLSDTFWGKLPIVTACRTSPFLFTWEHITAVPTEASASSRSLLTATNSRPDCGPRSNCRSIRMARGWDTERRTEAPGRMTSGRESKGRELGRATKSWGGEEEDEEEERAEREKEEGGEACSRYSLINENRL